MPINLLPRLARLLLLSALAAMPFATLLPAASPPADYAGGMHLVALAGLSLLACCAFTTLRGRLLAVLLIFAYSALLEYLQYLHPLRQGNLQDVAINALGCALGLAGYFFARWAKRGAGLLC